MKGVEIRDRSLKAQLGYPKITFILGGPASGKGTQCAKLVEEFGYTHISVGDLMREEIQKGTKDGEKIKKIVNQGGLVPFELTVQVLINGLKNKPSKNYLIDGFPRAVDQALYFESHVCECQNVIYYEVSEETLMARCTFRAQTSGRSDDNPETLLKRLQAFTEQSKPVVELYKKFGLVHWIDASGSVNEVYALTKKAMLPKVFFIIGPKCSGKTSLGKVLSERANMHFLNYQKFLQESHLEIVNYEKQIIGLIQFLRNTTHSRILIEGFPQTKLEANFFIKNCTLPEQIFIVKCSKDVCQERMLEIGKESPQYVSSTQLNQDIKAYNESGLVKYITQEHSQLKTIFFEIDNSQILPNSSKAICKLIEPTVIHLRPDFRSWLREKIKESLTSNSFTQSIEVNSLTRLEIERNTQLGQEFQKIVSQGKVIPPELIVRMLKKIIYPGAGDTSQYFLDDYPNTVDQAKEFETNCATLSAIIYSSDLDMSTSVPSLKVNNLYGFDLNTFFQKDYRLKSWSKLESEQYIQLNSNFRSRVKYILVIGEELSGKSTICKVLQKTIQNLKFFDLKVLESDLKLKKGTEDEPFQGEIDPLEIYNDIKAKTSLEQSIWKKQKYVIDCDMNLYIKMAQYFTDYADLEELGSPYYHIVAKTSHFASRYKKKNEVEEISEEYMQERQARNSIFHQILQSIPSPIVINTDCSEEQLAKHLASLFKAKVLLVQHDRRLKVDTQCANAAIKYNMVYICVHQLIRQNIESKSEFGIKLEATKKIKHLLNDSLQSEDPTDQDYFAIHYDSQLVIDLINQTIEMIREKDQEYVLLEGLCISNRVVVESERNEQRIMDDFFNIEKNIGEIMGILNVQFQSESYKQNETEQINYIVQPYPEIVAKLQKEAELKAKQESEQQEQQQEQQEDEEEKKKKQVQIKQFQWSLPSGNQMNLASLFYTLKRPIVNSFEFKDESMAEAITKGVNQFCQDVYVNGKNGKHIYEETIYKQN